jgi:hypothetical protein
MLQLYFRNHGVKVYRTFEDEAKCTVNLDIRWNKVITFIFWPLPSGKDTGCVPVSFRTWQ